MQRLASHLPADPGGRRRFLGISSLDRRAGHVLGGRVRWRAGRMKGEGVFVEMVEM